MAKDGLYISRGGKTLGPLSDTELQGQLKKNEINYTDYIWDSASESWQMLAVYFENTFAPPSAPPKGLKSSDGKSAATKTKSKVPAPDLKKYAKAEFNQEFGISNESIWFLYRDKEKYGPYRFLEIVHILQEQKCEKSDFIWKPGFNDWERIRNVPEFSANILDSFASVKNFGGVNLDTVFIKRAFPRVPYDSEVILHDDHQVVIGSATTISEGGAFVQVPNPSHNRGDRLKLHFSPRRSARTI